MRIFKICLLFIALAILPVITLAQEKPAHADSVMANVFKKAKKENKKVFLLFHASWCGWCKKMDVAMNDEVCKTFFEDNFVIVHLTVDESAAKVDLENAGGGALKEKYLGKSQGLPYWVLLDKSGEVLADAQMRKQGASPTSIGQNIGCPASPEEVEAFIAILKKTTSLTPEKLEIIAKRFRLNGN